MPSKFPPRGTVLSLARIQEVGIPDAGPAAALSAALSRNSTPLIWFLFSAELIDPVFVVAEAAVFIGGGLREWPSNGWRTVTASRFGCSGIRVSGLSLE